MNELSRRPDAYVRPSPTSGVLGTIFPARQPLGGVDSLLLVQEEWRSTPMRLCNCVRLEGTTL